MANLDTRTKRASSVGLLLAPILAPPLPDGTLDLGDRYQIAWSYGGLLIPAPPGSSGDPGGTDWFVTEIGRWVRGLTNQFDGHPTLARWKAEAEAAAIAGAPYPWFTSELQRRFLDYFISVQ